MTEGSRPELYILRKFGGFRLGAKAILESELARRLGVKSPSLINRRRIGTAPPYRRCECGIGVLYEDDDELKRWIEEHRRAAS